MPSSTTCNSSNRNSAFDKGEVATLAAKGAFLPNLNASSSFGVNIGQTIDPFTNQFATDAIQSSNVGLSSGLTLFNGFQNHLNLRRAKLGLELAATNTEVARNGFGAEPGLGLPQRPVPKGISGTSPKLNAEATARQVERVSKPWSMPVRQQKATCWTSWPNKANDISSVVNGAENAVTLARLNLAQLLAIGRARKRKRPSTWLLPAEPDREHPTAHECRRRRGVRTGVQFPDMRAAELQVTDAYLGLDLAKAARLPRVVGSYSMGSGYSQNRLEQIGESTTTFYEIPTTTPGVFLQLLCG